MFIDETIYGDDSHREAMCDPDYAESYEQDRDELDSLDELRDEEDREYAKRLADSMPRDEETRSAAAWYARVRSTIRRPSNADVRERAVVYRSSNSHVIAGVGE